MLKKLEKYTALIFIVVAWILSLVFIGYTVREHCERNSAHLKYQYVEDGQKEAMLALHNAPLIKDSLLATEALSVIVTDTYFAQGSHLQSGLYRMLNDSGFSRHCWGFEEPALGITINGGSKGVFVTLIMIRPAYLQIDSTSCNRKKGFYYDQHNMGGVFVKDRITCLYETKDFPAGTEYNTVATWIASEMKDILSKIKDKNQKITDHIEELVKTKNSTD